MDEPAKLPLVSLILVALLLAGSSFVLGKSYAEKRLGQLSDTVVSDSETTSSEINSIEEAIKTSPAEANNQTPSQPAAAAPPASSSSQTIVNSKPASGLISLNLATKAELETLPGIGEVKAQAILDYRAAHGGFTSLEELINVKGIGPATLSKIKPLLTL